MKFALASLFAVLASAQINLDDIPEEFLVDGDPPVGCTDSKRGLTNVAPFVYDYEIKSEKDINAACQNLSKTIFKALKNSREGTR